MNIEIEGLLAEIAVKNAVISKVMKENEMLLEVANAWMLVESEMRDNHPCPDIALRADYRKRAVVLTKKAIAQVEGK